MKWYFTTIKKSFEFNGRSRRKEFWSYLFWTFTILFSLVFLDSTFGFSYNQSVAAGFFLFASIIPVLSLIIRRLHDIGKNGWYILIAVIPFIGVLYLIYLMVVDSQRGSNEYGKNPKGIGYDSINKDSDILDDGDIFLSIDDL